MTKDLLTEKLEPITLKYAALTAMNASANQKGAPQFTAMMGTSYMMGVNWAIGYSEARSMALELQQLRGAYLAAVETLKEAGDVIECYHVSTGVDLGDASDMPFYEDTIMKIDGFLKEQKGVDQIL